MTFNIITFNIMAFNIMTFNIMTFGIMTFGIMAFAIMAFAIKAFAIMTFNVMTLRIMTFGMMTLSTKVEFAALCKNNSVWSAIMLSIIMLNGDNLSVIMNVGIPINRHEQDWIFLRTGSKW